MNHCYKLYDYRSSRVSLRARTKAARGVPWPP